MTQQRIADARFGLNFQSREDAMICMSAMRYTLVPGEAETLRIDEERTEIVYNDDWASSASEGTIQDEFRSLFREAIHPEVLRAFGAAG